MCVCVCIFINKHIGFIKVDKAANDNTMFTLVSEKIYYSFMFVKHMTSESLPKKQEYLVITNFW